MNKAQLIGLVAKNGKMKKKDAERAVNLVFETITDSLCKEEKVMISGFGSFQAKKRDAKIGRNPQTQEEMVIPSYKSACFSPGKNLKNAINR